MCPGVVKIVSLVNLDRKVLMAMLSLETKMTVFMKTTVLKMRGLQGGSNAL